MLQPFPIFMFHKIEPGNEVGINAVSPGQFRRHMEKILEAGYTPFTFRQLRDASTSTPKPCIITFDDGYESVYLHALPIMRELGVPGVVYVISDFIGKRNTWDANLGGLSFPHLNREQLLELQNSGWEIGSHGRRHLALPYLSSKQCAREIAASKEMLESTLQCETVSFAYPFGMHASREHRLVGDAGFRYACTGPTRWNTSTSAMTLPRIPVNQLTSPENLHRHLANGVPSRAFQVYLRLLCWGASLTPLYQRLFKPQLFAGK